MTVTSALAPRMAAITASASGPGVSTGPTASRSSLGDLDPDLSIADLDGERPQGDAAGVQAVPGGGVVLPLVGSAGEDPGRQAPLRQGDALVGAAVLEGAHPALDVDEQHRPAIDLGAAHLAAPQVVEVAHPPPHQVRSTTTSKRSSAVSPERPTVPPGSSTRLPCSTLTRGRGATRTEAEACSFSASISMVSSGWARMSRPMVSPSRKP